MWCYEFSKNTKKSPSEIWKLWTDVENWKRWDPDVVYSHLDGVFADGVRGVFKPRKGPLVKFELYEVYEMVRFTSRSTLPLTRIDFVHEMVADSQSTLKVTHRVEMSGFFSFLFRRLLGKGLKENVRDAVERLTQTAQGGN